jgi:hypothetical protein
MRGSRCRHSSRAHIETWRSQITPPGQPIRGDEVGLVGDARVSHNPPRRAAAASAPARMVTVRYFTRSAPGDAALARRGRDQAASATLGELAEGQIWPSRVWRAVLRASRSWHGDARAVPRPARAQRSRTAPRIPDRRTCGWAIPTPADQPSTSRHRTGSLHQLGGAWAFATETQQVRGGAVPRQQRSTVRATLHVKSGSRHCIIFAGDIARA